MKKHLVLLERAELRSHLPKTYWLTASTALQMLKYHSSIFLKPDKGTGGSGIIKIRRLQNGYYLSSGTTRRDITSASLYKKLCLYQKSSKSYIVQQGLHLARYKGKIFDIRMYLQKPDVEWIVSGMAARVASGNQYVTNYCRGGHPKTLKSVLLRLFGYDKKKVYRYIYQLKRIAKLVAYTLDKRFTDLRELGIDLAIAEDSRIWIIEANTMPRHKLFSQLPDKTMLYKIRKNKRLIQKQAVNSKISGNTKISGRGGGPRSKKLGSFC